MLFFDKIFTSFFFTFLFQQIFPSLIFFLYSHFLITKNMMMKIALLFLTVPVIKFFSFVSFDRRKKLTKYMEKNIYKNKQKNFTFCDFLPPFSLSSDDVSSFSFPNYFTLFLLEKYKKFVRIFKGFRHGLLCKNFEKK